MMADARGGRSLPSDEELARLVPPVSGGREVRVGLFVLAGILGILLVLFMMTDPATFRGRYRVATLVEEAGGVRNGDPVQMRGVNIGRVRGFQLTPQGVLIGLELEGEWPIPADSRARLVSGGLLGGRTVDIVPGVAVETAARGAIIPGELVAGVLEQGDDLGLSAQDALGRVRSLLSDGTIASVQGGASELESLLRELGAMVDAQKGELAELVGSLSRTAAQVEGLAEGSAPAVERTLANADSLMGRLDRTSETLERSAQSLRTVLERMERGEGTLGLLSTDEALYHNLNLASENLATLAADIRANPGRYIRLSLF